MKRRTAVKTHEMRCGRSKPDDEEHYCDGRNFDQPLQFGLLNDRGSEMQHSNNGGTVQGDEHFDCQQVDL